MARLSYLLLSGLSLLTTAASAAGVVELTSKNFDAEILKPGKPALVEFYAPWCGHCKNLAPTYDELGQAFAHASDKVVVAKVDADEHRDVGKRFGVQGFPTLKWFDGKSDKPVDYDSGRDFESLSSWITEHSGVKAKVPKKEPSKVVMLTDESFAKTIGKEKDVLVAFTAPWCGHCKSLAPTWETLAADFNLEPNVVIAKVDAEAENAKALTKEQGIRGYPTIKFFPKGSTTPVDYAGGRTEDAFISFLNENAGTNRAAGGGLNEKAGTIPVLDDIVARYTAGSLDIKGLAAELKKAAKGVENEYAAYYVKVSDKLSNDAKYAEKELGRLTNILKKGGSAPEKVDNLVGRSNVLKRFISAAEEKKDEL